MKHGGDIYAFAKNLKCDPDEIVDFSSNINLYHKRFTLELDADKTARYPDSRYKELKSVISSRYGVKEKEIALYNGATSAIYSLLNSLKSKNVYLYAPLYSEYEKAVLEAKKNVYVINRIEDIYEEPKKKSIVVFVNPSTPEGTYYSLYKLFDIWKSLKCSVILDESFLEFESLISYREDIKKYKKLYIVQSFSKFYSSAGVRVGAVFSNAKNIKYLKKQIWSVSTLDCEFLKQRLVDDEFISISKELHLTQKKELQTILEESNIFEEIVPSDTNFILTYTPNSKKLLKHLQEYKILVRECSSFDYLDENWLRFAIKDKDAHKLLKEGLESFVK